MVIAEQSVGQVLKIQLLDLQSLLESIEILRVTDDELKNVLQ